LGKSPENQDRMAEAFFNDSYHYVGVRAAA